MPEKKKCYKSGIYSVLITFVSVVCGLNGATIEPLVPLLTFIGSIDFDKPTVSHLDKNGLIEIHDNESTSPDKKLSPVKNHHKKKRGLHR